MFDPVLSCDGVGETDVTFSFEVAGAMALAGGNGGGFPAPVAFNGSNGTLPVDMCFGLPTQVGDDVTKFFFGGGGAAVSGVNFAADCGTALVIHT